MSVYKRNDVTKDGRAWVFQINYATYEGKKKRYTSKNIKQKKKQKKARIFLKWRKRNYKEEKL